MLDVRDDFPMLEQTMHGKPLVYLDSAATALTPQPVIDTISRFYSSEYGTVNRGIYALAAHSTDRFHLARQRVATFLNAPSEEEIIFTRGTTDGLNLLAHCLGEAYVDMGDDVVITEAEHHANIVPWQLMCESRGANLRILPVDERGELILEACEHVLTHKTKIISLSHLSNVLGTVNPIAEIVELAREVGALVVVDGAQAAPHMPIDVQALGCDFYTFSGHKVYGPTGIGALWGKAELLAELPPYQGGGDMIEKVTFEETTYNRVPYRFEAGTPNIVGALGLHAALDYLTALDLEKVHAHETALLAHATEKLQAIDGLRIYGESPDKGAIVSFSIDGCHPLDLGTLLDLQGIAVRTGHMCAQPTMNRFGVTQMIRASFAPYNTLAEIDQLTAALQSVTAQIRVATLSPSGISEAAKNRKM